MAPPSPSKAAGVPKAAGTATAQAGVAMRAQCQLTLSQGGIVKTRCLPQENLPVSCKKSELITLQRQL